MDAADVYRGDAALSGQRLTRFNSSSTSTSIWHRASATELVQTEAEAAATAAEAEAAAAEAEATD